MLQLQKFILKPFHQHFSVSLLEKYATLLQTRDPLGLIWLQYYKLDIIVAESMDFFNKASMTLPLIYN